MGDYRHESLALEAAIRIGLLTQEQVDALSESTSIREVRYGPRLDRLITDGLLSEDVIRSLVAEVAADRDTRSGSIPNPSPLAHVDRSNKTSILDTLPAVFAQWERFEIKRSLGQGGMGVVYEALDKKLGRTVALKFIQRKSDRATRRFLREARAQARVLHSHVCKVYDVGEFAEQPFVTMEYLPGELLLAAARRMSLEQKAHVVKTLAEALQAAHRLGIVHRDVKPGNIMVDEREDGGFHATIMDFGLARETTDEDDLTATGAVIGTPAYMAPEQARGEVVDRRADVYGLGAVLYHLLTGVPPFDGTNVPQVLLRVIHDEPVSVRKLSPNVPDDLALITMKCLCKVPGDRYDSGQALADDLGRYLSGEPIQARKLSWVRRTKQFVRNRRGSLSIVLLTIVTLTGLLLSEVRGQRVAERRARLAQRLGGEVESFDMLLRTAYLLPLHDIRQDERALRVRVERMTTEMQSLEGVEAALARAALGRAHLALREYDMARKHFDLAIAGGVDDSDTHAALGRTLGELYRMAREDFESQGNSEMQVNRIREIESKWLEPAKDHLQKAIETSTTKRPFEEALLALYSRRYDDAQQKAQEALAERPWLYEAKKVAADAHFAVGFDHTQRSEFEAAGKELAKANMLYREAADIARSDASLYTAAAKVGLEQMGLATFAGRTAQREHEQVQKDCQQALQADPRWVEALDTLFRAHRTRMQQESGGNQGFWVEQMLTVAANYRNLRPYSAHGYRHVAQARLFELMSRAREGLPPTASTLEDADENARKAAELDPDSIDTMLLLAHVQSVRALAQMVQGEDARARIGSALDIYNRVILRAPNPHSSVRENVARTHAALLNNEFLWGRDLEKPAQVAIASIKDGLTLAPHNRIIRSFRVSIHILLAEVAVAKGQNAGAFIDEAQRDLARIFESSPPDADAHRQRAALHRLRAETIGAHHGDPLPALLAARSDYEKAVAVDATSQDNMIEAIRLLLAEARFAKSEDEKKRLAKEALAKIANTMNQPSIPFQFRAWRLEAERLAGMTAPATQP